MPALGRRALGVLLLGLLAVIAGVVFGMGLGYRRVTFGFGATGEPPAAKGAPSVPAAPAEPKANERAPSPRATAEPQPSGVPVVSFDDLPRAEGRTGNRGADVPR